MVTLHIQNQKIGGGILSILLLCLLISTVSAAAGDVILFEQVNVSKNITQVWNNGSFRVYPVIGGVTSTDNIDQSQSTADTNMVVGKYANNRKYAQSFISNKSQLTGIEVNDISGNYSVPTGNIVFQIVADSSNSPSTTVLASSSYTSLQWSQMTGTKPVVPLPAILTPDTRYWIVISDSATETSDGGFYVYYKASNAYTSGELYTSVDGGAWQLGIPGVVTEADIYFKTLYAKNTEDVNLTVNGVSLGLISNGTSVGDSDGLLPGAIVDTSNGFFNWTAPNTSASPVSAVSAINSATLNSGETTTGLLLNGYKAWAAQNGFYTPTASSTALTVVYKINTMLPINNSVDIVTALYTSNAGAKTVDVSGDGSTWVTVASVAGASGTTYENKSHITWLNGNRTFYVRFNKPAVNDYFEFSLKSVNATLNTTSIKGTALMYQTGTNTINITSSGRAVSSSKDPSLMVNVSLIEGGSTTPTLPVASFTSTGNATKSIYPTYVQFTDTSSGSPSTWNWSFGDGTWQNGSVQNPNHFYSVAGLYTVKLYVNNTEGASNVSISDYVYLTSDVDRNVTTWSHFDGLDGSTTIIDEVGVAPTAYSGAALSTAQKKFGTASLALLSNDARVTAPSTTQLNFDDKNVTIEFWIYPTIPAASPIFKRSTGNKGVSDGWGIRNKDGTTTGYTFWMGDSAVNDTANFTLPNNQWSHLAVIINASATKGATVFVNGAPVTSKLYPGTYDTTNQLMFGAQGGGSEWYGYIDEFRMSIGDARWGNYASSFNTPYTAYVGDLLSNETNWYSTLRFKTDPTSTAVISNQTNGGYRTRTLQIQNVTNVKYILGSTSYDTASQDASNVRVNTSYYADLSLVSSSINSVSGTIYFNVTRAAGFNGGTDRVSFLDVDLLYSRYKDPSSDPSIQTFGNGWVVNATTGVTYPVHYFIPTNLTFAAWTFTTDLKTNQSTRYVNEPVLLSAPWTGAYPNIWNWSIDGTWVNGTTTNYTTTSFPTAGVKSVTVIAARSENFTVSSTATNASLITVSNYPLPVASFSMSNTSGQPPLPVLVTDTSTSEGSSISAWNWSFGDGTVSSLQNPPVHLYSDNGTFTINLTVTNLGGSSTKLQDVTVSFFASTFTATPSSGLAPLTVQFNETSTGKLPDSYYWEFGDGGTDTVQNPVHVYNTIGIYNVNHRIINDTLVVWNNKTAFIHVNRTVEANFTGTPLSGYLNPTTMSVSFTDTSLGEGISQWSWNFGDGSANATTKNPTHAYALPGTYDVFLKVWGADGNNSITKLGYITVNPLVADFTTSTVSSTVGTPISFNDTSDGYPVSWYWDFGDGTVSTSKNNSYAYSTTGTFTIRFRATNGVETSWKNETNLITITGALPPTPVADFEGIPETASVGSTIQFYDLSGNVPTSWYWEFGDGGTSTLKNPAHTYSSVGTFTVNLTATNSNGSDKESKSGYITITTLPAPTAAFTASPTSSYVGGTVAFTDASTDSPTSWNWSFGDGTTSTLQNPYHSYTAAGTYTVSLTATNVYGSDTLTKLAYITVSAVPPTIPPTSYVITKPATDTSNNAVTMNGYTAATTYTYHFEYGLKSETYSYSTKPVAGTAGNFSTSVDGLPLLPDKTYYFRAVIQEDGEYINGNELTYITSPASDVDSYPEFETREEALIEANWEFESLLEVIPSPFVDTMGNIFWGIIFGGAFFVLWARTHKIVIPALFGIVSGGMLWNVMPPSWVAFGSAMFYVSIAALVYWIVLGRQS